MMMVENMNNPVLDDLLLKINERYKEAIHAAEIVGQYLSQGSTDYAAAGLSTTNGRRRAKGTIRQRVLSIIENAWASIDAIHSATNIDKKQIRGVVYAPKLPGTIEKRTDDSGDLQFRYSPPKK